MLRKTNLHIGFDRSRLTVTASDEQGRTQRCASQENAIERLQMLYDQIRALNAFSFMDNVGGRVSLNAQIKQVGRAVHDLIFTGLEQIWSETEEFVVHHDQVYFFIPLELAFDGREFLCMRAQVGNVIERAKTDPYSRRLSSRLQNEARAVLCGYDGDLIEEAFASRNIHCDSVFDNSSLNEALHGGCTFLHFAGHGMSAEARPQLSLRGRHGEVSGELLNVGEFAHYTKLNGAFIFLNTCASGELARSPVQLDLVRDFLSSGAGGCIVATLPLLDQTAEQFATEFYRRTLEGFTVGEALLQTRRKTFFETEDLMTSVSYVLFGRPDSLILSQQPVWSDGAP
jgi:CHAT domain-containing protein